MRLKGLEKVREKLPTFSGKRLYLVFALFPLCGLTTLATLLLIDILPRLFPQYPLLVLLEPLFPIAGIVMLVSIAMWGIHSRWWKREEYRAKYGDLAYQKALYRLLPSISIVFGVVLHSFISVRALPPTPPVNDLTILFSKSILLLFGVAPTIDVFFRIVTSSILFIICVLIIRSSVLTFGVDSMMVIYLFFPEESELNDYEIYSVIRHPAYFAMIMFSLSGFLFRLSVYSLLTVIILVIALDQHLKNHEEKELIERFGESYIEYMNRVPALHVRVRDLRVLFKFILMRNE